jgi:predicted RNA-binding protein (virulence factor B family)
MRWMIGGSSCHLLQLLSCFWMLWHCSSFLHGPSARFIINRSYVPVVNSCSFLFQKNEFHRTAQRLMHDTEDFPVALASPYKLGQEVKCKVMRFTPLGAVVVLADEEKKVQNVEKDNLSGGAARLNDHTTALINCKEVQLFEIARKEKPLSVGENLIGYISHIRQQDGKLSVQLRPRTGDRLPVLVKMLEDKLKASPNQYLPVGDKSSPEEIMKIVGISKNDFKRAVGTLYRRRIIEVPCAGEIKLVDVSNKSGWDFDEVDTSENDFKRRK